jgi:exonuclease SbcD
MRILHTSDWHVGKTLRGESRLEEHAAVLAEITGIARAEQVDLVLVTGDLFESAAPPADAKALVWQTLLDLHATGARVFVVAGNHDHAAEFAAVAPVFDALGVTVAGHAAPAEHGGVIEHTTAAGERARVALLPFVSQRYAVRAEQLLGMNRADAVGVYAERLGRVVEVLCSRFSPDTVNLVAAHLMVRGGVLGGGERDAQTVHEYAVPAAVFPAAATYVALGHLHRAQELPAACPVWYAGSPIQVDFGEGADDKQVLLVDAEAGRPARVRAVPVTSGWRLRTVEGTLEELRALAESGTLTGARLRVRVREAARVGLADEVRALLPGAVEVGIDRPATERAQARRSRTGRGATDLFAEFLADRGLADERLERLFAQLLDEVSQPEAAGQAGART